MGPLATSLKGLYNVCIMSFDNKLYYHFKTIDEAEAIPVVKDQESGPTYISLCKHRRRFKFRLKHRI